VKGSSEGEKRRKRAQHAASRPELKENQAKRESEAEVGKILGECNPKLYV
jgi:hypothetical protein